MAEMTYNITLTANHQSLTAEYLPLAAESVQYLTAKVVCETEDWAGREIKAMFGQGCTVHEVSVTGGEITAKQQLNLTAGDWCVWLVGNSARDGEVIPRITTNVAHISVAPTGGTEGNPFPTPPPTVEEQLRADMGNLADLTTEDKSSLVAAINEAAASGGSKDAVTYTPQTLTEGQQKQARTNIGALDVNIETTPVDTNRTFFGVGKNIVYVKDGWLKPCPVDADKELADNYANAVLGFGFINTDISVVKGEAKSAFSLYQQGLISDKGTILKNPLDVAQYITWTAGTTNNKTYIDYRHVEHNGFYEYCRYFEDDTYSYPRASYSLSNNMSDSKPRGSVAQYAMSANPTKDMHIATKLYVDTAKTEAQQLGLTAATPGQIIKVKTVQDGKPTEWEAVNMPSGGSETWEKLYDGTIQIEQETMLVEVDIPRDDSAKEFHVYLHFTKNVAQEWDSPKLIQVHINGAQLGYFVIYDKLTSDYYCFAKRVFDTVGRVELVRVNGINPENNLINVVTQLQNGSGYEQTNTGKIRISFAAAYAGSIELLVYGRY